MFVVALTSLVTPIDLEATALAADLGLTAYETRMTIAAGLPAVLMTTPDRERALDLLGRVRARGHGAVACDADAVASATEMISIRRFRFEPDALVTDVPPDKEERLPYADILAGLRAIHKRSSESKGEVQEKKFAAGRALATGGLMMTKKTTREVTLSSEDREQVFYLFRRSGQTPWILTESGARYAGLGPDLVPTLFQNFLKTIERIKELANMATYDDRLLTAKKMPERTTRHAGPESRETSSADGVDLMAHLLALSIARNLSGTAAT